MTASLESHSKSRRRILWVSFAFVVVAGFAGLWYWYHVRNAQIDPPTFETADVDRAVVRALEGRTEVVRRSRTARAWGELGMTFLIHRMPDQAVPCFRQAQRLQPEEPRWPYFQAVAMGPETGMANLRRAVKLCGNSPDAPRLKLAEWLTRQDQVEEAAEHFAQVLRQDPENSQAHLGLARFAYQRGDLEESLHHLSYAVKDEHTRKAAYQLLAQVHQEGKDSEAADQAARQAQRLPPDLAWPDPFHDEMVSFQTGQRRAIVRANEFLRKGQTDDAVTLLEETVREYPESEQALTILGTAYTRQGDLPAAETVLGKALELSPNSTDALFRLGVVYFQQDRTREAAAKYRRAIELKPDFAGAYYNLGHCLIKDGDHRGAIAAFRSTLQVKPENASAHRLLGMQLAEDGQNAEAIIQFQEALKLDPDDRKARNLLEAALKRKPD